MGKGTKMKAVNFGNLEVGETHRIVGTIYMKSELARFPELVKEKGGGYNFEGTERLRLFEELIPEVDAVDIELRTAIRDDVVKIA